MYEVPTPITMVVGEVEVRGTITAWCISDIAVEITHPFVGLRTSVHMMAQALGHMNYKGDAGILRAKGLLYELYEIGRKTHRRVDSLRKGLIDYDQERGAIEARQADLAKERSALRASFKAEKITQTRYQQAIEKLAVRQRDLGDALHSLQDRHMLGGLATDISMGDRDGMVRFVRDACENDAK